MLFWEKKTKNLKLQPNGLKTKTAPQTGTEVTAVSVGDKFFNIIIIPIEPYQQNGWKTEIRSSVLQLDCAVLGEKTKNLKLQPNGLKITAF